jgi:hypothetical protein
MPAAVLTVHQTRFVLAFGGSSGEEMEKGGHQYLSALAAAIAMSVAIVARLFFAADERLRSPRGRGGLSLPRPVPLAGAPPFPVATL